MALNAQQEAFALAYALCGNATEAALRAGYSQRTAGSQGHRLLKHDEIAHRIEQQRDQLRQEAVVNEQWVLARLVAVYEKAFTGAPKTNSKGQPVYAPDGTLIYDWSPSGANKALELIGRHLAMFTDKVEATLTTVTRDLVDEEIQRLEGELAKNDPKPAQDAAPQG